MTNKKSVNVKIPEWLTVLPATNPVIQTALDHANKLSVKKSPYFADMIGEGENYELVPQDDLFYRVISETAGCNIADQGELLAYIGRVSKAATEYNKIQGALDQMGQTGYGVMEPMWESFKLAEPQEYRSGKNFGVKLRASGTSVHLVRVDVECEVAPIIGDKAQSDEMLKYLKEQHKTSPDTVWETPIFGKSLESIVREEIASKANSMPAMAKQKMQKTITRVVNNGKGGVICILL